MLVLQSVHTCVRTYGMIPFPSPNYVLDRQHMKGRLYTPSSRDLSSGEEKEGQYISELGHDLSTLFSHAWRPELGRLAASEVAFLLH
jgi:hypothetical protein